MQHDDLEILGFAGIGDPVSSITHLAGAAVFACLSVFLLRRGRGHDGRLAVLGIFAFSCVLLLTLSGVYHLFSPGGSGRFVFQRLDHAAIFILIAGTFTAVHGILFRGVLRWGVIAAIWAGAAAGVVLKTAFFDDVSEWFGLSLYLLFGWSGIISGLVLWSRFGWSFVRPLVWGGLAYTSGALLEFLREPLLIPGVVGSHEIFHAAVLAGVGCHWKFIHQFAGGGDCGAGGA